MISSIELLGAISSVETLESGIREIVSNAKKRHDNAVADQNLDSLDVYFREEIDQKTHDICAAEKLDGFIALHSNNFKPGHDLDLFSSDDRDRLKSEFYEKCPDLKYMEKQISPLIDRYVDELNKALNKKLDYGVKFLSRKIDQLGSRISKLGEEPFASVHVDATQSGKKLRDSIEAVLALIKMNTEHNFQTEVKIPDNYFIYSGLDDLVLKLPKLFSILDKQKIESVSDIRRESEIESLHAYVCETAPDFSVEVNSFFFSKIIPTLEVLKTHEHKSSSYYWAIGKMGLEMDEDDKILRAILDNLEFYFLSVYHCLQHKWRNIDYRKADTAVTLHMHNHILERIRCCLVPSTEPLVRKIYEDRRITDRQLSEDVGMSVKELRRLLYPATKSFLMYEYVDDKTTMLSIKGQYRETIRYFFERGNGL